MLRSALSVKRSLSLSDDARVGKGRQLAQAFHC